MDNITAEDRRDYEAARRAFMAHMETHILLMFPEIKENPHADALYPRLIKTAQRIMKDANTMQKLAVFDCNGATREKLPSESWDEYNRARAEIQLPWIERRQKTVGTRLKRLAADLKLPMTIGGDPRGYVVKVFMSSPNGTPYNSWGGAECGYGVPTLQ